MRTGLLRRGTLMATGGGNATLRAHGVLQVRGLTTSSPLLRVEAGKEEEVKTTERTSSEIRDNSEGGKEVEEELILEDVQQIEGAQTTEDFLRQTRRTFGDTLPKDYLTEEEYSLYERLYGPPLRESKYEDLHIVVEEEEVSDLGEQRRHVLLRESEEDGAWEEVELGGSELTVREVDEDGNVVYDQQVENELDEEDVVAESDGDEGMAVRAASSREVIAIDKLRSDMEAAAMVALETELATGEDDIEPEEDEASVLEEEELSDDIDEEDGEEMDGETGDFLRSHPHTIAGRWGTKPATVIAPRRYFTNPITELLTRTDPKHIQEAAEKAFGGPGLPYSSATPQSKKKLMQKHIGLEASQHNMSDIEADSYMAAVMPGTYASVMSVLIETRKRLGAQWLRELLFKKGEGPRILDAGAGGGAIVAWREVMRAEWEVLMSQDKVEYDSECPQGNSTVLTGSDRLRYRISRFLENTTFLPRLPDYLNADGEKLMDGAPAQGRKYFDIIVAPHTLLPLKEDFKRKNQVQNLWSLLDPNGGVLIILEKGIPRGFEAVAGARSLLLQRHISSPQESFIEEELQSPVNDGSRFRQKGKGMIIAPCTNHNTCPMYYIEGTSEGRKDFCHFQQRFERPGFLNKLTGGGKGKNHEDIRFSYLAVRRGVDTRNHAADSPDEGLVQNEAATLKAFGGYEDSGDTRTATLHSDKPQHSPQEQDPVFNALALPRAILPPLKRRGHVTLDLCTPHGQIERWTVPRSFSRQAYRDARKSSHGDLWALGAKTRTPRNIRLGKEYAKVEGVRKPGKKALRKGNGGQLGGSIEGKGEGSWTKDAIIKLRRKEKKERFVVDMGEKGLLGVKREKGKMVDRSERRSKGGRRGNPVKELTEKDFH